MKRSRAQRRRRPPTRPRRSRGQVSSCAQGRRCPGEARSDRLRGSHIWERPGGRRIRPPRLLVGHLSPRPGPRPARRSGSEGPGELRRRASAGTKSGVGHVPPTDAMSSRRASEVRRVGSSSPVPPVGEVRRPAAGHRSARPDRAGAGARGRAGDGSSRHPRGSSRLGTVERIGNAGGIVHPSGSVAARAKSGPKEM